MAAFLGRRLLRRLLPKSLALRLRQEWIARRIAGGGGHLEPEVLLLPQLIGPQDVCWDIGANAGMYTVAMAKLARHVVAFEPVPHNFRTLEEAISLAGLKNVDVRHLALAETKGTARFSVPVNEGFYGGYYMAAFHDEGELEVDVDSIDGLIASGVPEPSFIKCDVEGAEPRVVNGARDLIARRRPAWLLEALGPEIFPLMTSLGYVPHVRTPDNALRPVAALDSSIRNYIFLPEAQAPRSMR